MRLIAHCSFTYKNNVKLMLYILTNKGCKIMIKKCLAMLSLSVLFGYPLLAGPVTGIGYTTVTVSQGVPLSFGSAKGISAPGSVVWAYKGTYNRDGQTFRCEDTTLDDRSGTEVTVADSRGRASTFEVGDCECIQNVLACSLLHDRYEDSARRITGDRTQVSLDVESDDLL